MTYKVYNLATSEEYIFDDSVNKTQAVCTSYCIENGLSSWFFAILSNKMRYIDSLPLTQGGTTIACGDWCATLD